MAKLVKIPAGITNGQSMVYDSASGLMVPASLGGGGGSALAVQDEGTTIDTAVTQLNFVGAGVVATDPLTGEVTVTIPSGGGGGDFLFAGSLGGPNTWVTTSSTSLAAVDTTNAIFSFVAPASGKVVITLEQAAYLQLSVGNNSMAWGLINASGGAVLATSYFNAVNGSSTNWQRLSVRFVLTGLTAGTTYTLRWAHLSSSSSNVAGTFNGGGLVLVQAA